MSRTYSNKSAVPWWAAFGAPLVGVPVLVVLLALGTAGKADGGVSAEPGYATEQAEALQAALPPVVLEQATEGRG